MKRFTRKNSNNKELRQFSSHSQRSQSSQAEMSSSRGTVRNLTANDISMQKSQSYSKPAACLVFSLFKSKIQNNLRNSFREIKQKSLQLNRKNKTLSKILAIDNKFQYSHKRQSFYNIKYYSKSFQLKIKGLNILSSIFSIVNKKNKFQAIFKFTQLIKSHIKQQNLVLKNIQAKYAQNYIPQEYIKQYRRLIKITSKNNRILLRNTQEVLQPSLNNLSNQLQARRIKKSVQSDTQIIISIIRNYIQAFKQANSKFQNNQNELKLIESQRQLLVNQIKNITIQIENKIKQFKKYDLDITQRCDIIVESGPNSHNLRLLDRVVNQQIKMCESRGNFAFEYTSRIVLLKTSSIVIKKLLENVQNQQNRKQPSSPRNFPINKTFSLGIKKKVSIIQQLNSFQQSDIIDEIRKVIDQLIQKMKSQVIPQSQQEIQSQVKFFSKKIPSTPQLVQVYKKLEQVLKIYLTRFLISERSLSQSQIKLRDENRNSQLIQNLQTQNKYLQQQITKKISKLIKNQEKIQSQKAKIQQLTKKLESVQSQLTKKTKQLEQVNQKSQKNDNKITEVGKQYKRFKKLMKESIERKSSKEKSSHQILEKSLFNSIIKQSNNKTLGQEQSRIIINHKRLDNSNFIKINHTMSVDESYFNQNFMISPRLQSKKKKNQKLKDQLTQLINQSYNQERPEVVTKTIQQLSSKLIQSQKLLNEYSEQISKMQKKEPNPNPNYLYLLPENISTLMYHIMLRIKKIPENSQLTTLIWSELDSICQQSNGVKLLAALEDYTVEWLMQKVIQPLNNKLKKLDRSSLKIEECFQMPKTPRRSPKNGKIQNNLMKTVKNSDILETYILDQ